MKNPENAPLHIPLSEARSRLAAAPRNFIELLKYADCSVEFFSPKGEDTQQPHAQDELYIISAGSGKFRCSDRIVAFTTGDVLFVPAGVSHRFETFSDDFETWVVFFGPAGGSKPQN